MGTTAMAARQRSSTAARTAVLASADIAFRRRVREVLTDLRWQVREAAGGAETLACLDASPAEAVVLDSWLPDLEIREFIAEFERLHPGVDLVMADASAGGSSRSPRRNEILHALRRAQETDGAIWNAAPSEAEMAELPPRTSPEARAHGEPCSPRTPSASAPAAQAAAAHSVRLPEFIGSHPAILDVSRRVRLVAPRSTPVLIEGPTGSGKELVARAVHRLSPRSGRRMVALNCAAIPEALLEAELFGHTRGAFTGAVQGRTGRIEAAHGGTLFLDEIGEMPLALQAKLLRFVECGELQRVGDNETAKVDVRIVAATHRPLARHAEEGRFRSDLYYRLAVFLIRTPALGEHAQDLPLLVEHFMEQMGKDAPVKRVDQGALKKLAAHDWPGNVRELEHVLERGAILAGDEPVMTAREIDFGLTVN